MGKLILVPSREHSHTHVMPFKQGEAEQRVQRGGGNYDPLSDFLEWYGIGLTDKGLRYSAVADSYTVRHHFWNFREEVEAWIEANCQHDALVQKDTSVWKIHFFDRKEICEEFTQFIGRVHKTHLLKIVMTDIEQGDQIDQWMAENVRGQIDVVGHSEILRKSIFIRDGEEAVHFRLRWADHVKFIPGDRIWRD